jgi:hypothetical protein
MPDFVSFSGAFSTLLLITAMLAVGVIIFVPTFAKFGFDKIESLFGVSFKEGLSRLERKNQENLGRSMARDAARKYYKNNPRKNRPVPYKFWRK